MTIEIERLLAGGPGVVTRSGMLLGGQNLARGAVLGRIAAGGRLTLSDADATDGSQVPIGVLAQDCDASGGDRVCIFHHPAPPEGGASTTISQGEG